MFFLDFWLVLNNRLLVTQTTIKETTRERVYFLGV